MHQRALTKVVATCYLLGVSTRRMDKIVETLGITSLSKSQGSVMAKELDAAVEAFRTRPLDAGPYTFVAADALVLKVRRAGRCGQRARPDRHECQRLGLPRDPRHRRHHRRGRGYRGLDVLSKSRADQNSPTEQEDSLGDTDRLTHYDEESHDDVVHHVHGLDPDERTDQLPEAKPRRHQRIPGGGQIACMTSPYDGRFRVDAPRGPLDRRSRSGGEFGRINTPAGSPAEWSRGSGYGSGPDAATRAPAVRSCR